MEVCFSTAYLPPIAWYRAARRYEVIGLEAWESWQKQSYRNRCYILGPNGAQMLNIPIVHNENKKHIGSVEISYREDWQHTHWQAIKTAYGNAPFYEVLAPSLKDFYRMQSERLFDWNRQLIEWSLHWLRAEIKMIPTQSWQREYPRDYREYFHPKRQDTDGFTTYPQVFDDVMPFQPNLSILDLLMNEGPAAYDYL